MSGRWFRFYDEALDDPKVQQLPLKMFRAWVNILCLAARHDGKLPAASAIAFALRMPDSEVVGILDFLCESKLLDHDDEGLRPHNWNGRQYKADVSTERVKRFRKRHETVSETPSDTESDAESDTEQKVSVAKATGVPPRDIIFADGLAWLTKQSRLDERMCRGIIGRWLRDFGDDAVLAALQQAETEGPLDPVPWITAKFKPREPYETWDQKRIRLGMEAIKEALPK